VKRKKAGSLQKNLDRKENVAKSLSLRFELAKEERKGGNRKDELSFEFGGQYTRSESNPEVRGK